jgi:hypothetical protein
MPQHRHCPPAKHREGRNPKHHEEQQKDVAGVLAEHPPNTVNRKHKKSTKNEMLHADKM